MVVTTQLWIFVGILSIGTAIEPFTNRTQTRQKKLFSLFNIVTFKNDPCTTTGSESLGGTCMTASECTETGGSPAGNCAAGFGVCCLVALSGNCGTDQMVKQNCSYIQNNGFPSANTAASQTCIYNFKRICDNLCQIRALVESPSCRLDFRTFSTLAPGGICGANNDALTVSSPFSGTANGFPPSVCGTLTGQHMYFETGTTGDAGILTISQGIGIGSRTYDIKATYYTCNSLAKAPAGCTQYFVGESGSIQSYNFAGGQLLGNQQYTNCIRQELGFCQLRLRASLITTPNSFLFLGPTETSLACGAESHIIVTTPGSSMFCGNMFTSGGESVVLASPGSFEVGLRSLLAVPTGATGFSLDYDQVPCT